MKAVYLTAGAAGMYCGSCMHDNALARALIQQGVDCVLQPIYTPIRTDDDSVAQRRVFFGGIHVYLLQQLPWLHWVPGSIRRTLDWAPLIRLATRRSHATDAAKLGELAVSMLSGLAGRQGDEVQRIVDWMADEMKPDAVLLSNLLIGGMLPVIRQRLPGARRVVILQGDDVFLDHLPPDARREAIRLCRELVSSVDRFVVNSSFYAEKMGNLLEIPDEKMFVTPLSIDTSPYRASTERSIESTRPFRLGYMARIAPEKGLHHLVDSFINLAGKDDHHDMTLHVAGWLGENNRAYFDQQMQKLARASLDHRMTYHGSPSLQEKVDFLRSLDLLSVPTDYQDPKGLFILEALAAGVPVIQPDHGAFGELLQMTGGGVTVPPGNTIELAAAIERMKMNPTWRAELARLGHTNVHANHGIEQAAEWMRRIMFD